MNKKIFIPLLIGALTTTSIQAMPRKPKEGPEAQRMEEQKEQRQYSFAELLDQIGVAQAALEQINDTNILERAREKVREYIELATPLAITYAERGNLDTAQVMFETALEARAQQLKELELRQSTRNVEQEKKVGEFIGRIETLQNLLGGAEKLMIDLYKKTVATNVREAMDAAQGNPDLIEKIVAAHKKFLEAYNARERELQPSPRLRPTRQPSPLLRQGSEVQAGLPPTLQGSYGGHRRPTQQEQARSPYAKAPEDRPAPVQQPVVQPIEKPAAPVVKPAPRPKKQPIIPNEVVEKINDTYIPELTDFLASAKNGAKFFLLTGITQQEQFNYWRKTIPELLQKFPAFDQRHQQEAGTYLNMPPDQAGFFNKDMLISYNEKRKEAQELIPKLENKLSEIETVAELPDLNLGLLLLSVKRATSDLGFSITEYIDKAAELALADKGNFEDFFKKLTDVYQQKTKRDIAQDESTLYHAAQAITELKNIKKIKELENRKENFERGHFGMYNFNVRNLTYLSNPKQRLIRLMYKIVAELKEKLAKE